MPKHLTEAQLSQFRTEGYVFPFRAVSPAEAAEYRARIEAYEAQAGHDANRTLKIKGNLAFPWLMDLGRNPRILDAVEDVIGPNILHVRRVDIREERPRSRATSHGIRIPPTSGSTRTRKSPPGWVSPTARSRKAVSRSCRARHLGPDLHHIETHARDNMLAKGQSIEGLDEKQAVHIEMAAGEFSLHHERTAHASEPNRSDDRRIGFAFFYIPTHVRSTIGRRQATLVRGVDEYGHWDADQRAALRSRPAVDAAAHRGVGRIQGRRSEAGRRHGGRMTIALEYGIPTDKESPLLRLGIERGFFRDEGIDITLKTIFGGPEIARAYDTGALKIGEIGSPPAITAIARGSRFRIVASNAKRRAVQYFVAAPAVRDWRRPEGQERRRRSPSEAAATGSCAKCFSVTASIPTPT